MYIPANNIQECGITEKLAYLAYGMYAYFLVVTCCNDPMIGSYNYYHLSPNDIPRGNQRWYGLVYLVNKSAGWPRTRPRKE